MNKPKATDLLSRLDGVIRERAAGSDGDSYVRQLMQQGHSAIAGKVTEEARECVDADASEIVHEIADLWFHSLVLAHWHNCDSAAVISELERRFGTGGNEEKRLRQDI